MYKAAPKLGYQNTSIGSKHGTATDFSEDVSSESFPQKFPSLTEAYYELLERNEALALIQGCYCLSGPMGVRGPQTAGMDTKGAPRPDPPRPPQAAAAAPRCRPSGQPQSRALPARPSFLAARPANRQSPPAFRSAQSDSAQC